MEVILDRPYHQYLAFTVQALPHKPGCQQTGLVRLLSDKGKRLEARQFTVYHDDGELLFI